MEQKEAERRFREAYHEYGYIRCQDCGAQVDFSDDDSVNDAIETWNDHVRENDE